MVQVALPLDKMVDLLVDNDWVFDVNGRKVIRQWLRDFHPGLRIEDSTEARDDIYKIVSACSEQPFGLHSLVEIMDQFQRGSRVVTALQELVQDSPDKPLLTSSERSLLHRAIRGIEPFSYVHLVDRAIGGGPWPPDMTGRLPDILLRLEQLTIPTTGPPPLLVFLAGLRAHPMLTDEDARTVIEAVLSSACDRLGCPPENVAAVARRSAGDTGVLADEEAATLIARLKPDPLEDDVYVVSAWLQRGRRPGEKLVEESPWTLADLPDEIDRLLAQLGGTAVDHAMPVEFILPRELMNEPVDQWVIGPRSRSVDHPLGSAHPVVIRSLERLDPECPPKWRGKWERKWGWVREHGTEQKDEAYEHVNERVSADRMTALLHTLDKDPAPACVVFHFTPPDHEQPDDELTVALSTGVPIALWRRDAPGRGSDDHLTGFAADTTLASLSGKTFELRREVSARADRSSDHLGHHLVLLWDDFDRQPEAAMPLASPERKS